MSRILATLGVLLAVLVGSVGVRSASRPPAVPFLVRGASEIEVVVPGSNERQISYRVSGSSSTWFVDLVRELEHDHWLSPDRSEYGPLNRTYTRASSFGIVEVREWVFLRFDPLQPQAAHIRVRRVVAVPWWPRLSRVAERWRKFAKDWVQDRTLLPVEISRVGAGDVALLTR